MNEIIDYMNICSYTTEVLKYCSNLDSNIIYEIVYCQEKFKTLENTVELQYIIDILDSIINSFTYKDFIKTKEHKLLDIIKYGKVDYYKYIKPSTCSLNHLCGALNNKNGYTCINTKCRIETSMLLFNNMKLKAEKQKLWVQPMIDKIDLEYLVKADESLKEINHDICNHTIGFKDILLEVHKTVTDIIHIIRILATIEIMFERVTDNRTNWKTKSILYEF